MVPQQKYIGKTRKLVSESYGPHQSCQPLHILGKIQKLVRKLCEELNPPQWNTFKKLVKNIYTYLKASRKRHISKFFTQMALEYAGQLVWIGDNSAWGSKLWIIKI